MKKTIAESGRILTIGLVLLFILAVPAQAWENCPPCKYWDSGQEKCVCRSDGASCGGCCECEDCSCVEKDSNCSGCCECEDCSCVNKDSNCSGCCKCSGCSCEDRDSECTGCKSCSGCSCVDDDSNCTGCESCNNGSCVDDDSKCFSACKVCISGSCVDNCPPCHSCVGDICQYDCTGCETCVGETCESICDPAYCESCIDDECKVCEGDTSKCCDNGTCVDKCTMTGQCSYTPPETSGYVKCENFNPTDKSCEDIIEGALCNHLVTVGVNEAECADCEPGCSRTRLCACAEITPFYCKTICFWDGIPPCACVCDAGEPYTSGDYYQCD